MTTLTPLPTSAHKLAYWQQKLKQARREKDEKGLAVAQPAVRVYALNEAAGVLYTGTAVLEAGSTQPPAHNGRDFPETFKATFSADTSDRPDIEEFPSFNLS